MHRRKGDKRVTLAVHDVHVGNLSPLPAVGLQAVLVGVIGNAAQEDLADKGS